MAIETISQNDLKKKIDNKENIQILNVLSPDYYDRGSIKGSLKIPFSELEKRFTELDSKQDIVTYCAGPSCEASKKAAEWLATKGFNVRAYEGGLEEWSAKGLPMESGAPVAVEPASGLSGMPR